MNIYHCYKITNSINGKVYIGQTVSKNPKSRWNSHKYTAYTKLENTILCKALRKHGVEKFIFEVICCCTNIDDLNETETILIKQHKSHISENGYNMQYGGNNKTGFTVSKETRINLSNSLKNRHITDSHRKNISIGRIGCKGALRGKYGTNHPLSKRYKITFKNGKVVYIQGLQNWCKHNGYCHSSIYKLISCKLNRVKDIISVEILTS